MVFSPNRTLALNSELTYPLEEFDYQLLDSGDFNKLERFGPYRFIRPAGQAIWSKSLPEGEWKKAHGEFKHAKGSQSHGEWTFSSKLPEESWILRFQDLSFKVQPTGFGHMGLFPEQAPNWIWIKELIRNSGKPSANILNIFGYTGAGTLAAASVGASVTHIDGSKPTVTWAKTNLELSGLGDKPVRWIVDDAMKFLKRELRRGNRYDGVIMDPPSFGRGPKGEVWKIEKHLPELIELCRQILTANPLFFLLSTHSPGFSALSLKNLLLDQKMDFGSENIEADEMFLYNAHSGLHLPNGFFARWCRRND